MDDLLDYVYALVCRFIGDDPRLQNDMDDLVQDVFVRILPKLEDGSVRKPKAFAYLATYSICMNAKKPKKTKISPILAGYGVYKCRGSVSSELEARRFERFYDENKALIEWIDKETDPGVRKELRKQLDELIRELQ